MLRMFVILIAAIVCFSMQVEAGTLSIPSQFVLQRPLNPALITETQNSGLAVSSVSSISDAFFESDICEAEIFSKCGETGLGGLGYKKWKDYHFQVELQTLTSSEEGNAGGTKIKNRRDQRHYLGMIAGRYERFSFGAMLQHNQSEYRKRQSFSTGRIENGGDAIEWSLSLGGTVKFWDQYYFSLYRESVVSQYVRDINGRKTSDIPALGFYGLGVGGEFTLFENWKIAAEFYGLFQRKTFEQNELLGAQFDVSWKDLMAYATFVHDVKDNYFERSGGKKETVKMASGLAWYGKKYQIQLGRDPRFFDGLDGGLKFTFGFQF
ncbi:MAG: hypothetical protein HQM13_20670 [SAR324 cluster bacterium]|nr:hypothetical protein [SAR324 cluster bacterium]